MLKHPSQCYCHNGRTTVHRPEWRSTTVPPSLTGWVLALVVLATVGCHRQPTNAPRSAALAAAPSEAKPIVHKVKHWDGSVSLIHSDNSSTLVVWPMQLRGDPDGGESIPVSKRCERIAHGAPYVNDNARASPNVQAFEALLFASLRAFDRAEVEQKDPCSAEFGADWRVPSRAEFTAYAAALARTGTWYLRAPKGTLEMVDYAPKLQFQLGKHVDVPARIRTALANTAHVFCLRTAPTASSPTEPSREEIEQCVQRFHVPQSRATASAELPEPGLSELIAVRQACREDGPSTEWLRILDGIESKVLQLATALLDPELHESLHDRGTADFIDALFSTMRVCIEQPRNRSAQSNASALVRLHELETILSNAHETRARLLQQQREVPVQAPLPLDNPKPTHEPRTKRCGCPVSDLACNMRCAARN